MTATGQRDLISVITADHRAVEAVFSELENRTGSPEHRRDLADHVIAELLRHSVAEERFLYPVARTRLPDGDEVADKQIAEHAEAERVMRELEALPPSDPLFEQLLAQLMQDIRTHIQDEEHNLLPRLRSACSAEELRDLGEKVLRVQ